MVRSAAFDVLRIASLSGMEVESLRNLAASAFGRYRQESHSKSDGGRRVISIPDDALKTAQRRLLRGVLSRIPAVRDDVDLRPRNAVRNAKRHRTHRHITSLDVRSAFPSVKRQLVFRALVRSGFTRSSAGLICDLCVYRDELPQGAPTSPALLTLVLAPIDHRVSSAFQNRGLTYTRYVDDITLSGPTELGAAERMVERELQRVGFELNAAKTERGGPGRPVRVTGSEVSLAVRVPEEKINAYRRRIADDTSRPEPTDVAGVRGVLSWVRSVNKQQARELYNDTVPEGSALRTALTRRRRKRR